MISIIWSVVLAVFIVIFYRKEIRSALHYRRKLIETIDLLPGPPAIPILGCTYRFSFDLEKFTIQMNEAYRKYGLIGSGVARMWIGPFPFVFLCRADSMKAVFEDTTLVNKPIQYEIMRELTGDGLLVSNSDKWHQRRRLISPAFHFNVLKSYTDIFNKHARELCEILLPHCEDGKTFDLLPLMKRSMLDIITETALGQSTECLFGKNKDYCDAVCKTHHLMLKYLKSPWLWVPFIRRVCGHKMKMDKHLAITKALRAEMIERRLKELEEAERNPASREKMLHQKGTVFLDTLIDLWKEGQLSMTDVQDEVDTFMLAGHDSTAVTTALTLFALGHHQDYQNKCYEEICAVTGGEDRDITYEDTINLKYVGQCHKESMRLWTPIMIFARIAQKELKIGEFTIPANTPLCIIPTASHHDPEQFPNPDQYNPDNFSPENVSKRNPFAFVPFSAGIRNCIGQKFAYTEGRVQLAAILRRYKIFSMVSEEENLLIPSITGKPKYGVPIRIEPR
ncbi:hypothetical protein AB6A40_003620 [Gnathostoma spinigerum]|uniref:Cytochrome P450 n=1 Tax=Gnathostoma spinigerum TaxID=75299 RepID=A0ABD6EB94_9BILA